MSSEKDHQCNLCGLSCSLDDEDNPTGASYGLLDQKVSGGYSSTPGNGAGALDDSMEYTFSLCEFCLDWLFVQCKIPPKVYCYIDGKSDTWRSARQRITQDDWRRFKEKSLALLDRHDKARGK
jgi:hypothetical protein